MRIIGGRYKGRTLRAPPGLDIRPTSDRARESVFDILEHGLDWPGFAGGSVVDLFAGTGALGLEALSRGAGHVTFIDAAPPALGCIRENAGAMGQANAVTLLKLDATRLLHPPLAVAAPCVLALLDPPYDSGLAVATLEGLVRRGWIGEGALCVVEVAARESLEPPAGFQVLDERVYGAARMVFLSAPRTEAMTRWRRS